MTELTEYERGKKDGYNECVDEMQEKIKFLIAGVELAERIYAAQRHITHRPRQLSLLETLKFW